MRYLKQIEDNIKKTFPDISESELEYRLKIAIHMLNIEEKKKKLNKGIMP